MDSLPERLQSLAKNKYFAVIAVVVFAFVTALIFALIAFQSQGPTVDELRQEALDQNRVPGRSSIDGRSPISKVIDAITGRKPVNDTTQQDGTTNTDGTSGQGGTDVIEDVSDGTAILDKIERDAIPLPKVEVDTYVLNTQLPQKPAQTKIHTLKTDYSEADVRAIALNLGLLPFENQNVVVDKSPSVYQIYDLQNDLFLAYDLDNGSYIFSSDNGVRPSVSSSDPRDIAESFMIDSGLSQDCLTTTAAYESQSEAGVTIVEMRCDWDYLGAPFVNTIGVLNLDENTPLTSVRLGDVRSGSTTFGADDEIDEDFGQRGADDFNTVLIKIRNNSIIHIGSNVPQIESSSTVSSNQIIAPLDALNALNVGNTNISLSSPAGAGYVELPKVYPNGLAEADEAKISDFMLAYTTIPGFNQTHMCPVWVSRSSGVMNSGYNGLFVSTLQAVNDARCDNANGPGGTVAGVQSPSQGQRLAQNAPTPTGPAPTVQTGNSGSIKYDDLVFEFSEVPALGCPEASTFTNAQVLDASKGIYMMWKAAQQRKWYIVYTTEGVGGQDFESNSNKLNQAARTEYLRKRVDNIRTCKPRTSTNICPIPDELTQGTALASKIVSCVLLTTGSPSLYVHTDTPRNVRFEIAPHAGIGFADPVFNEVTSKFAAWDVFARPSDMTFANGITRHRAYYEFRRFALLEKFDDYVARNGDVDGIVVKMENLIDTIEGDFAAAAGLSEVETKDIIAEVVRETRQMNSENVRVSLLPQAFVDTYLPVSIQPQPLAFDRYILYIEPTTDRVGGSLDVQPATGTSYSVIETGLLVR